MNKVWIIRYKSTDEGTQGILVTEGFSCKILELPWRYNKPNISKHSEPPNNISVIKIFWIY